VIGNDADGVNRFARAACGDDDAFAGEGAVACEDPAGGVQNILRLCHAPLA
jgi:hypothetical protein